MCPLDNLDIPEQTTHERRTETGTTAREQRLRREARALSIVKNMHPEPTEPFEPRPNAREQGLMDLLSAPSHVYFVYSAGRVKIGYSIDWRERIESVCQGCPHYAELILVMPGDKKTEDDYHLIFHESRMCGEWFRLEGNVRRFLNMFAAPEGIEALNLAHEDFLESLFSPPPSCSWGRDNG